MKLHPVTILCLLVALSVAIALTGLAHAQEPPPEIPATLRILRAMPVHTTDADEDPGVRHERLRAIAEAIDAATDKRAERAAVLTIGYHESHYARDVQTCERTGDKGRAVGLFQSQALESDPCPSVTEQVEMAALQFRRARNFCRRDGDSTPREVRRGFSLYGTGRSCYWAGSAERLRTWRWIVGRLWQG